MKLYTQKVIYNNYRTWSTVFEILIQLSLLCFYCVIMPVTFLYCVVDAALIIYTHSVKNVLTVACQVFLVNLM